MNTKQLRAEFKRYYGTLFDLSETTDTWGNPRFVHESIEAIWYGWKDRAALQSQDREDAERYRALRAGMLRLDDVMPTRMAEYAETHFVDMDNPTTAEIDAAIDHARRVEGDGE